MVSHLFPKFLDSVEEYRSAESFWQSLIADVAAQHGQRGNWQPWQSRKFANGTPMPLDGNPICDARSEHLGRAIRIIQSPPDSDEVEIAALVDTFDFSESGGPGFTEELIVNLALSEEAAKIARDLFGKWMDPSVSRERMEDLITTMQPKNH